MIKYFKCKDHKAIEEVYLSDLSRINVLCGKNNSGKTSIFEALTTENKYEIGIKISNYEINILKSSFDVRANRYSNPNPVETKRWFNEYINKIKDSGVVWYSASYKEIKENFNNNFKQDLRIGKFNPDIFEIEKICDTLFQKIQEKYKPILIPPKRTLEGNVNINLNESIGASGSGVVNKLFYLKNQDIESKEYKKYLNIYKVFTEITNHKFNITPDEENVITLYFKSNDNNWIPAKDCGLGLADILIIVTIVFLTNHSFVFIEEPENHLHAEFQKNLFLFIRGIKEKQFFISTHSSIFLNDSIADKLYYTENITSIAVTDQTSKSQIINSLGYSVAENLVADIIILTEGPSDIPVIKMFLSKLGINENYNIRYWPLGGDIMSGLDLSVFAERKNVFAIIDSDPGSSVQRTRFLRKCKDNSIECIRLERYSIENYFTVTAIRKAFPNQIPSSVKEIDPNINIDKQIGFDKKNKTIKTRNGQIAKEMDIESIIDTDLYAFLVTIKEYLEGCCNSYQPVL